MENNVGIEEILRTVEEDTELKRIIIEMYNIAQKRIIDGRAGIYSDNYKILDERSEKAKSVDGGADGKYFKEIDEDCLVYQRRAAIQYIDNVMEVNSKGVAFESFDGKISFPGSTGFIGHDMEIERLFDKLVEKYVEIHPESREEIMGDSSVEPVAETEEVMESSPGKPTSEPKKQEGTPIAGSDSVSTEVSAEVNLDLEGPASVVQYRLLIKKEMKKVENQLNEAMEQLPKDEEVDLSDLTFKKVIRLKKRYEGLREEYERTLDMGFQDKHLERAGILNKPISGLQTSIDSLNKKIDDLEKLKPTLKASSSKGITDIKISLVKKICKILSNFNVTATSIQRGLILPKTIYDIVMNKYVTHYEAKDEYFESIISDVSTKLDTLDESKFFDKIAASYNKVKLTRYKKKKEILDDFLSKSSIIPIVTITGSRIRSCKKDILRKKRNSTPEEEVSIELSEGMSI